MNKTANYTAFYVDEPLDLSNLGVYVTKDFCYYNTLKLFKKNDNTFPFIDAHEKTYDVRDGSDWEKTLKPRLHERLNCSKNIILFLSSVTKNSKALREEIEFGALTLELPIIVVYPDFDDINSFLDNGGICEKARKLWDNLPVLKQAMEKVPTIHIPMKKELIRRALNDNDLTIQGKQKDDKSRYIYKK